MREQLQALYELLQIDIAESQARKSLAALEKGDVENRQMSALQAKYIVLSNELKKLESDLQDSELNLQSVEEKIKNFQQKLYSGQVTNPKELSSIEKEIEMLGKSRGSLDERILGLYDQVEAQRTEVGKYESAISRLKKKIAAILADYNQKSGELNKEIESLTSKRRDAIMQVTDKTLLQRYESVRSRHKDTGLALVENNKCGGCHTGLTVYTQRLLWADEGFHTCENCGRILYLKK